MWVIRQGEFLSQVEDFSQEVSLLHTKTTFMSSLLGMTFKVQFSSGPLRLVGVTEEWKEFPLLILNSSEGQCLALGQGLLQKEKGALKTIILHNTPHCPLLTSSISRTLINRYSEDSINHLTYLLVIHIRLRHMKYNYRLEQFRLDSITTFLTLHKTMEYFKVI